MEIGKNIDVDKLINELKDLIDYHLLTVKKYLTDIIYLEMEKKLRLQKDPNNE